VNRRVQEDLLFAQTLTRSFERSKARCPMVLIVGSAEPAERGLAARGFEVVRHEGALVLSTPDEQTVFERIMRDTGRKLVEQLTDVGISSVGFFGADKGILRKDENGIIGSFGVQTIAALSRSGVVSVLICGGLDSAENVVDLHPTTVCHLFQKHLSVTDCNVMGDIVLLVPELRQKVTCMTEEQTRIPWDKVMNMGLGFDKTTSLFALSTKSNFYVSSAPHVAGNRGLRVGA